MITEDFNADTKSDLAVANLGTFVGGAIDLSHAARTELLRDPIMRNALTNHGAVTELMGLS